jgi:short-subunit dehydrogenase
MREQKEGCIVICSSGHAFQTYPNYTAYAATKGGLLAFMRAAALDCGGCTFRRSCLYRACTTAAGPSADFLASTLPTAQHLHRFQHWGSSLMLTAERIRQLLEARNAELVRQAVSGHADWGGISGL